MVPLPLSRPPKGERLDLKLRQGDLQYPEELSQLPLGVVWTEVRGHPKGLSPRLAYLMEQPWAVWPLL